MSDGPRLLVVDDEDVVCRSCRRIFEPRGFDVTTSKDAAEALSLATEHEYDAILLDIKMPVMDGIQFLQQLRNTKPDIPVIFITGYPSVATAASATRLGAADYVTKPFTPHEVVESVERLLRESAVIPRPVEARKLRLGQRRYLPKAELNTLVQRLKQDGHEVLGPRMADGVVSLRPIQSADDLARGVKDEQNAGRYRLRDSDPDSYFRYGVGAEGPKRYFFPPRHPLFGFHRENGTFALDQAPPPPPKLAILGVRPCELAAIAIQDRVFGRADEGHFRCELDVYYKQARDEAILVAVNCTRPSGTCFCVSMGTGPQADEGFDLSLTELGAGFVIEVGSELGAQILDDLPAREPSSAELELADLRLEQAKSRMRRELDTRDLPQLLNENLESPVWEAVAKRCLGCGNCTMVCPTCFCSTVIDTTGLDLRTVRRVRYWESCYTHQFSYTTGGPLRSSIRARYRHWLRHKLATWHEQFGSSGCVGCGRCITWCPVGIDLTKVVAAIRGSQTPVESSDALIQGMLL